MRKRVRRRDNDGEGFVDSTAIAILRTSQSSQKIYENQTPPFAFQSKQRDRLMHRRTGFQIIARGGYVARGIVFLLLRGLALFTGTATTKSALDSLLAQPFGQVWLGLIGLGLVGFVVWRLAQAIANADNHKQDFKRYAVRAMLFGSAVVYIGLAYYSFDHALGFAVARTSDGGNDLAGWAMSQPFGRYLAALIGVGFLIGGLVTVAKGVMGNMSDTLNRRRRETR